MPFAQLLLGSPGSGKSTYCNGMHQFLSAIGRKCSVVNLDPANDTLPYPCALDIRTLVKLEAVMIEEELGPNGGVMWAMEELEANWEWFEGELRRLGGADSKWARRADLRVVVEDYVLFDCPGQVELFTHHESLRNIFFRIQKLGYRLVALHLTDSYALTLPSLYISTLLLSLRAMLQMDLPHLNILTKIDKLSSYGPLPFNLDYYTEVQDLAYLIPYLKDESPMMRHPKFEGLNNAVIELVEDFSLVGFETLAVEDKKSMMTLLQSIDRAGGYAFGGAEGTNDTVWQVAMREGLGRLNIGDVQERWIDNKEEWDEKEQEDMEHAAKAINSLENDGVGAHRDRTKDIQRRLPDSGVKVVRKGTCGISDRRTG